MAPKIVLLLFLVFDILFLLPTERRLISLETDSPSRQRKENLCAFVKAKSLYVYGFLLRTLFVSDFKHLRDARPFFALQTQNRRKKSAYGQ